MLNNVSFAMTCASYILVSYLNKYRQNTYSL